MRDPIGPLIMAPVYFTSKSRRRWGVDGKNNLQGSEWEAMVGDLCHRRALSISASVSVSTREEAGWRKLRSRRKLQPRSLQAAEARADKAFVLTHLWKPASDERGKVSSTADRWRVALLTSSALIAASDRAAPARIVTPHSSHLAHTLQLQHRSNTFPLPFRIHGTHFTSPAGQAHANTFL